MKTTQLSQFKTEDLLKEIQVREELDRIAKQQAAAEVKIDYEKKQREANKELKALISQAEDCINKATKLADTYGLYFSWDVCGYGMGGGYQGAGSLPDEDGWTPSNTGWQASSQSC